MNAEQMHEDMSYADRLDFLKNNADQIKKDEWWVDYTEEELAAMRKTEHQEFERLTRMEAIADRQKKRIKTVIDALKSKHMLTHEEIKKGKTRLFGEVHWFFNMPSPGRKTAYDAEGKKVKEADMTAEEKSKTNTIKFTRRALPKE